MNIEQTLTSVDAFNFDAMNQAVGKDPFAAQANKYAEDTRFYKLGKDKEGNGAAIIRFLPDAEMERIIEIYRIGTTISKNGKKRFVNEFTPASIGQPCPFQEEWARLYNSGDTDGAKTFGRSRKFISNIKVIKDPKNPENEGKIFLYEYSGTIKTKLDNAQRPSEQDMALGKVPKEIFNPLKGHSFRLVSQKGANGQINYDLSEVVAEESSIYGSVEEAVADIKTNTHSLSGLLKPEAFMSYDELVKKFKWVTWADADTVEAQPAVNVPDVQPAPVTTAPAQAVETTIVETPAPVAPVEAPAPVATSSSSELDALMAGLTK